MTQRFDIHMFPASEGDCFWIRYGNDGDLHNILIDGGRRSTAGLIKKFIKQLPTAERRLELLVVSHVDRDHIDGILKLTEDEHLDLSVEDIWFNAYQHLQDEMLGAVMGEKLSENIVKRQWPWNKAFSGGAVRLADDKTTPIRTLAGGMQVRLLSPDAEKLRNLVPRWERECQEAGIMKGHDAVPSAPVPADLEEMGAIDIDELADSPFTEDDSEPNGSSIAFTLEYGGRRALFAADAHPDLLLRGIEAMSAENGGRVPLDVFKIPHHGSKNNLSKQMLELIDCQTYLLSTSGSQYHHPDQAAVARILKYGGSEKVLVFNYRSDENTVWDATIWQRQFAYQTRYPEHEGTDCLTIPLLPQS